MSELKPLFAIDVFPYNDDDVVDNGDISPCNKDIDDNKRQC